MMMLLRASYCSRPVLYRATQRAFPARGGILPTSTSNNLLAINARQLYNRPHRYKDMSNSPYVVPDSDESGDDDPMLALAIKLSLQQSGGESNGGSSSVKKLHGKRKADLIVISDTEEDDKSSRKVARGSREGTTTAPTGGWKKKEGAGSSKSGGGVSSMGFDRAQMERERLERLGKTMPSFHGAGVQQKGARDEGGLKQTAFSRQIVRRVGGPEVKDSGRKWEGISVADSRAEETSKSMYFPNGTVKKTWVYGVPRDGSEITIEEVLGKDTLYGAVLSAYQWNHEWVWSKIPNGKLQRFVLVMQAKTDDDKELILSVLGGLPKTTIVFPPMETGVNCMHMFLIDLPKLSTPRDLDTQFATSLYSFCKAKGIPIDVLERLNNYDYSATRGMAFVHSIGGAHYEEEIWKNTGYPGLGTAIKNLGYSSGKDLEVDFVTSSLGATKYDFVTNMYNAAMGFDGTGDLARRPPPKPAPSKKKLKQKKSEQTPAKVENPVVEAASDTESDIGIECDEETSWERVKEKFRVYFPSRDTVINSKGGLHGAGTICFQKEMWEQEGYSKDILRDCVSARTGILMHNKMLFARPAKQLDTPVGNVDAWAYIGSANLSESAWGKLVMCAGKKKPKIKCKNWECGVIVPIISEPKSGQELSGKAPEKPGRTKPLGMEVFGDVVPVPMHTPGENIHPNKKPWFHHEIAMLASQVTKMRKKEEKEWWKGGTKK